MRHEDSLRGVLNFSKQPLPLTLFYRAQKVLKDFIQDDETDQKDLQLRLQPDSPQHKAGYKKITLVKQAYVHCGDKETFLEHFFASVDFMLNKPSSDFEKGLHTAEDLLDGAQTNCFWIMPTICSSFTSRVSQIGLL